MGRASAREGAGSAPWASFVWPQPRKQSRSLKQRWDRTLLSADVGVEAGLKCSMTGPCRHDQRPEDIVSSRGPGHRETPAHRAREARTQLRYKVLTCTSSSPLARQPMRSALPKAQDDLSHYIVAYALRQAPRHGAVYMAYRSSGCTGMIPQRSRRLETKLLTNTFSKSRFSRRYLINVGYVTR